MILEVAAFKDEIDRKAVERIAAAFASVDGEFDSERFVRAATRGLVELELKARIAHVAAALHGMLDRDFAEMAPVLVAAAEAGDLRGWTAWPVVGVVEAHGTESPGDAFLAMAALTGRCSCEFAIRPLIETVPVETFAVLDRWVQHPDPAVRRLVSEGTRPRLPWGLRLRALQRDPRPVLALLDCLHDDPDEIVRRSVANHLNDIAKDHPDVAIEVARRWHAIAAPTTPALLRRALRTLVKQGDHDALSLLGYDPDVRVEVDRPFVDGDARLGSGFSISVAVTSLETSSVDIEVDYVLHRATVAGKQSAKVWKLGRRTLQPGSTATLTKRHSLARTTVRTWHPGDYLLEIQVNGTIRTSTTVRVRDVT